MPSDPDGVLPCRSIMQYSDIYIGIPTEVQSLSMKGKYPLALAIASMPQSDSKLYRWKHTTYILIIIIHRLDTSSSGNHQSYHHLDSFRWSGNSSRMKVTTLFLTHASYSSSSQLHCPVMKIGFAVFLSTLRKETRHCV